MFVKDENGWVSFKQEQHEPGAMDKVNAICKPCSDYSLYDDGESPVIKNKEPDSCGAFPCNSGKCKHTKEILESGYKTTAIFVNV